MDKVLTALGRTFISAGVLVFLFVAYQLWGTNITEAKEQDKLLKQTDQFAMPQDVTSTTKPGDTTPPNTTPAPPPAPQGAAVAVIKIPKINLQKAIVEGTSVDDLKKGPGHYTGTPLPGQPGNAAIAGHRTTYGAPFGDIGELKNGDQIQVTTKQGSFTYVVSGQQVVDPSNVSVLNASKENKLTLTTCHPKYSAAQRLVITAKLDTSPAPAAPAQNTTPTSTPAKGATTTTVAPSDLTRPVNATLSGQAVSKQPAITWGICAALVAFIIWIVGKLWRRWPVYILGAPIFLVVLFIFFENFSRLLPANA